MKYQTYFKNKTIWITGASSGIGAALTHALADCGATLVVSGRNLDALNALRDLYPDHIKLVLPFDVSNKKANLEAGADIQKKLGGLDIAIFNAGISQHIDVEEFNSIHFEKVIKVNYLSLVYGVEAVLSLLRQSKTPHIVGMSSMAAYAGLPTGQAYSASKAAVKNFLEGLRIDLLKEKIPVSILCPGFIKTPLTDKHDFHMPFLVDVDVAAKKILKGIAIKKEEVHFPKAMTVAQKLLSSLPSPMYTKIMGLIACRL